MTMTIEQQALALVNEVSGTCYTHLAQAYEHEVLKALRAALERHEAFRQEVSEAVSGLITATDENCSSLWRGFTRDHLSRFIIAPPVDPVVLAIREMALTDANDDDAERLRAALAKHGLQITGVET